MKQDPVMGLALLHTLLNVIGVLVFLPFIPGFTRLLTKMFPEHKTTRTIYINSVPSDVTDAAISSLKKEIVHLIHDVLRHNLSVLSIDENLVVSDNVYPHSNQIVVKGGKYEHLKLLQAEIFTFAANIQKEALSKEESEILNRYLHAARMALYSAKTLKDVHHNFEEFEFTDNRYLNEQYAHFRKRLIDTYLDMDKILSATEGSGITTELFKLFKSLHQSDKEFIARTVEAVNRNDIRDIDVSNAVVVNRALYQSSRQLLLAIRDLLLTEQELEQFEGIQDISDEA
jgi:phosphate:Na+ symporter